MNRKNKHSVEYPNVQSAIRPVVHGPGIPISEPSKDFTVLESLSSTDTEDESAHDLWDQQSCGASSSKQPKLFTQDELNDLRRDLNLSKESAQLLGSRLRDHSLYWLLELHSIGIAIKMKSLESISHGMNNTPLYTAMMLVNLYQL